MKQTMLAVPVLLLMFTVLYAASHKGATYQNDIQPMMENLCFACHGDDSPALDEYGADKEKYKARYQGPRMTSYEMVKEFVTGEDAGALMRRLDDGSGTRDGEPGNMFVYLGDTNEERKENLSVFKEWVGHWTHKRSHELTEEDMNKFSIHE